MQNYVQKIIYTPIDRCYTIEIWLHDEFNDNELDLTHRQFIYPCNHDSFMGYDTRVDGVFVVVKNNL